MSAGRSEASKRAPAKLNLVLHVGPRRQDGLHELCSLFASLELADELAVAPTETGDRVDCPGVEGENLAVRALAAYRAAAPADAQPPPLAIAIHKRVPVAGGLGGGSSDAAAVLRAADGRSPRPLGADRLREIAAGLGSDVPSQVEPRHALVTGAGEKVEPVELAALELVLVPSDEGLSTAAVYAEHDRLGYGRARLDPVPLRRIAAAPPAALAVELENDLAPAALSLRPELERTLASLHGAGALAAMVAGSGPTVFGLFENAAAAEVASEALPRAIRTRAAAGSGER